MNFFIVLNLFVRLLSVVVVTQQKTTLEISMKQETDEWARYLSKHLSEFSEYITRRKDSINSFRNTTIVKQNGMDLLSEISDNIMKMMRAKERAVKRIKTYAEFLSLYRNRYTENDSNYEFFDSKIINDTEGIEDDISKDKEQCKEFLNLLNSVANNELPLDTIEILNITTKPAVNASYLDIEYDPHFNDAVNLSYSAMKLVTNVYGREKLVLKNIHWSERLDMVFRCNYLGDKTLTWQYFASSSGFMRLYPAIKWSEEEYDNTYDFRMRSWYSESMALPKDMIILMDSSGSMRGERRIIANIILHDILDTLTDNDYINVYTFNNSTAPLVNCFDDSLVQANEENLRLIRESLPNYKAQFPGNLSLGFVKAFELLANNGKQDEIGAKCNKVIMVVTEGLDYFDDESHQLLARLNERVGDCQVRIFTYQLGTEETDAAIMQKIACDNMGYYVNVSNVDEVREKVVKYLSVMSRSINLYADPDFQPIWSALYVDLTDRRLTNWLWQKEEGLLQRELFLKLGAQSNKNPWEKYRTPRNYTFLTTVSMPVYDKRNDLTTLLGVAAVDVPTNYLKKLTKEYLLGVNGYASIITNNGYVLMHPDHRTKFKKILKPTFNRVDLTEVELSSDTRRPRIFDAKILKLRENIVTGKSGAETLKVMTHMDDMKRIYFGKRLYFYTPLEPYSLIIALPEKYGLLRVKYSSEKIINWNLYQTKLEMTSNWVVHPDWLYFKDQGDDPNSDKRLVKYVKNCKKKGRCKPDEHYELLYTFLQDFLNTIWFDDSFDQIYKSAWDNLYNNVTVAFLATHSGLTRWKNVQAKNTDNNHFSRTSNKTVDEMWYKRTVEENYNETDIDNFIFSTPLDLDNEFDDTKVLVTVTNALFRKNDKRDKVPIAVIGYEVMYKGWRGFFDELRCGQYRHTMPDHPSWSCLLLDNHGYVVYSEKDAHIGKLILDINRNLTDRLEEDGIFESVDVFDYQGICFPRVNSSELCPPSGYKKCRETTHAHTLKFMEMAINKTIPTPCDKKIKLYRYRDKNYEHFPFDPSCSCPYIVRAISKTNLVLLAVTNNCCERDIREELKEDYPQEVLYKDLQEVLYKDQLNETEAYVALPCFIQRNNNFNETAYIKSIPIQSYEYTLNKNVQYCGGDNHKHTKDEL